MFKKIGMTAASLLMLAACHSNPYSDTVGGKYQPEPPVRKPTPVSNFYIEVTPKVDMVEGSTTQIKVKGTVPSGDPVIRYDKLPGFISADRTGSVLTATPTYGDSSDPKTPGETSASYLININLSSTDTPAASVSQTLVVIVHRLARATTIAGFDAAAKINEGSAYSSTFQVQSPEFPQGPFTVSSADMPVGLKISPTSDPTRFTVSYTPGFQTVTTMNRTGYCGGHMCASLNWKLTVVDPRGQAASESAFWQVVDIRQNPLVVTPSPVIANFPNADFYVQVEDPNGEVAPQVTYVPSVGKVDLTVAATSPGSAVTNPYAMMHAQWTENPPASKGTTQTLEIKSCVFSDVGMMNQCVTSPVNVQF